MTQTQIEPRCPYCNASGVDKITAQRLGGALLLYCGQCGAIHGVVPAVPKPAPPQPSPAEIGRGEPGGIGRLPPAPKRRLVHGKPDPIPRLPPEDPYKKPKSDEGISPEEALAAFGPSLGQHGFYTRIGYDDDATSEDDVAR